MAMAQRLEVYHRAGDGAKAGGEKKGSGRFLKKQNKKGIALTVQRNETEEIVQVIHNRPKKQGKGKGKGRPQQQQQKKKQFQGKCFNCGGDHLLKDCKEWKEMRQKFRSSGNYLPGPLSLYRRVTRMMTSVLLLR